MEWLKVYHSCLTKVIGKNCTLLELTPSDQAMIVPNHSFAFDFEEHFDKYDAHSWMTRNFNLPFYIIAVYMTVVFGGKTFMKDRQAYDLRRVLVLWNATLAVFSILGASRAIPVLLFDLRDFGFHFSVCSTSNISNVAFFWAWLFTMSKFPELGDTLFIVLRKQKLIFLHWYHHVTVLLSAWFGFCDLAAPARWFATMNYTVHAFMYSYYALRAMKVSVPRWIAMFITIIQILQMMMGAYVCLYSYRALVRGEKCQISQKFANFLLIIYSSYFMLFVHFFYKAYLSPKPRKMKKVE